VISDGKENSILAIVSGDVDQLGKAFGVNCQFGDSSSISFLKANGEIEDEDDYENELAGLIKEGPI
jgi:hypothetical protein